MIRPAACLLAAAGVLLSSVTGAEAQRPPIRRPGSAVPAAARVFPAGVIQSIRIEGNQRIEEGTIRSYMLVAPGDPFDSDRLDRSLKTLYATGLFQDVDLHREGDVLIVKVVENPIINKIAFEGNHKLTDEQLRGIVQLRSRAVFTAALAQADRQRILDAYAKKGYFAAKVEPKIIRLDQNRVDVVFEIADGDSTLTSRISFVGNHAFSEADLKQVISSREEAFWRFLSTSDNYDPERLRYDRELLRRYYLKHGYADIDVVDATAELSPDRRSFFLTFTVNEGERYKVSSVAVKSTLRNVNGDSLLPLVDLSAGDWYDGDAVERSVRQITDEVQNRGISFVEVKPQVSRNKEKHTIDVLFNVGEGPRVFVERIDIVDNTRTKDKVIRREFRFAEGDPLNAALVRKTRERLNDLGYFSGVDISNSPGSAPDKAIVTTSVKEKATGELTLGGGYSTDSGFLINAGLRERNLLGTGIDASLNGVLAQRNSSIDLSVTDPYLFDRNIVGGGDLFYINNNNQSVSQYSERRAGGALRTGWAFSDHLFQTVSYSLVDRDVYNVQSNASFYIQQQAGYTLLSQVSQALTLDYRDSKIDPHSGFSIRGGTDYAGLGGNTHFVRAKIDGLYLIPLDRFTGNSDWGIALTAGFGYLFNEGQQEQIIDRFFLGGDNLRGFQAGGAGPHDQNTGDSLGGRLIWTQSTELRFPLPISPDLGLSGRTFADIGGLTEASFYANSCKNYVPPAGVAGSPGVCPPIYANPTPRVAVGVGVSWKTPFGLINIDIAEAVVKEKYDQTQIFRFGFGTRF